MQRFRVSSGREHHQDWMQGLDAGKLFVYMNMSSLIFYDVHLSRMNDDHSCTVLQNNHPSVKRNAF